jgi:hypothetical protein
MLQRTYGVLYVFADMAGDTVIDHLGYRAAIEYNHWGSTRNRLDHDKAERLGPVDRKQQCLSDARSFGWKPRWPRVARHCFR